MLSIASLTRQISHLSVGRVVTATARPTAIFKLVLGTQLVSNPSFSLQQSRGLAGKGRKAIDEKNARRLKIQAKKKSKNTQNRVVSKTPKSSRSAL
jgi:hypothetical protein